LCVCASARAKMAQESRLWEVGEWLAVSSGAETRPTSYRCLNRCFSPTCLSLLRAARNSSYWASTSRLTNSLTWNPRV